MKGIQFKEKGKIFQPLKLTKIDDREFQQDCTMYTWVCVIQVSSIRMYNSFYVVCDDDLLIRVFRF